MNGMFVHRESGRSRRGYVVGIRKAAVDAYVLVDFGSGSYAQIDMTRPRFDTLGIAKGSEVLVAGEGDRLTIVPL